MSSLFQSIPERWQRTALRHLARGPKNGAWGSESGENEIDAICVRVADFDWPRLSLRLDGPTTRSFNKRQFKNLQLRQGDIVIEKSGGGEKTPVGRVVSFDEEIDAVTSNFVARIRPHEGVFNRFFLFLLAAHYMSGYSHQFIKQNTGIQNLDDTNLFRSEVWVPDFATQRQIADFLDRETARIDLLIKKRERFAALVTEARNSLVAEMICGQGSETLDANRDDWTDACQEHWKSERAKVHFRERIEKSVDGFEELLTVSHITGVTTRAEKEVNMFLAESNEGYKIVHSGDIVINTMWGWMGAMGVSSHHGIISPSYGVYRPISEAFEPGYLDLMLRSKPFIAEVTRRSKGIHSSRLRIYPDAFLDLRLPVPPRDEQVAILTELRRRKERENVLLAKNEQASALLKEYRSALITAAVTGQIDVQTYARSGTTNRRLDAIQEEMSA